MKFDCVFFLIYSYNINIILLINKFILIEIYIIYKKNHL